MGFWSGECEKEPVKILVNNSVAFPSFDPSLHQHSKTSRLKLTMKNNTVTLTEYTRVSNESIPTIQLRINGELIENSHLTVRGLLNRAIKTRVTLMQDAFIEVVDSEESELLEFYEAQVNS